MKSVPGWKKQDGAWLALAICAHALLLLLPLKPPGTHLPATAALSVHLVPISPTTEQNSALEGDTVSEHAITTTPQIILPGLQTSLPFQDTKPDSQSAAEVLTTARLLEMARTLHPDNPGLGAARQLGIPAPRNLPANWRPGTGAAALQSGDNLFKGMSKPVRTEIVDRWLAADGSHHVVVNLPNGQTLCGRAEAWNPLQPLVEHLMMFGTCGGGGKRTFNMNTRESATRATRTWADRFE